MNFMSAITLYACTIKVRKNRRTKDATVDFQNKSIVYTSMRSHRTFRSALYGDLLRYFTLNFIFILLQNKYHLSAFIAA